VRKCSVYLASLAFFVLSTPLDAAPLGSTFTYQGTLAQNGTDVTDICDFSFGIWDALAGGAMVAGTINVPNVSVQEGTFTVQLDFGGGVFGGDARWLEIAVACPTGGGLTTLTPRQKLTPSPNALFAAKAGAMEWTGLLNVPPDIADGDDVDDDDADPANEIQDLADVLAQGNDAGGTTITNLPAPVADSDASTKAYVDSQGGAQDLTDVLTQGNDAGGITITNLPAPVAASNAATKAYVDAHEDADADATNELQDLSLAANTLSLSGDASPVDLSQYLDNTDDQALDLTADQLSIENGNSVDLSTYLDDTDDQSLAEVLVQGNDAGGTTITNLPAPVAASDAATMAYVDAQAGGSQNLTEVLTEGNDAGGIAITNLPAPVGGSDAANRTYVDSHADSDADPTNELQDLSLAANTLSLTGDGTSVNLAGYLDNTDDQTLDFTADQLSIENGNSVDLSGYLDNTDDQNLAQVLAEGNNAGGTTITNLPAPVAASDAATMAYVDAQAGGSQNLTEVLTEGNNAGGITITNLPAPITGTDAATMAYVDAHEDGDADSSNELQDLSLAANTLNLSGDASPVSLSAYLDNTDDQTLDFTADQLSIENGNSVDLSGYLDNTDDQNLAQVLAEGNNAGGASISNLGTTTTNALTISALDCTANANGGALTTNASGVVVCSDDEGGSGAGNTLDQAYDQGGPGAGRTITADAGPVTIQGTGSQALNLITNFDPALVISPSSGTGEDTGIAIVGARNGSTTVDAAFVDLRDFDDNEGAGTLFTMARIGAGMQDAAGQTGFLRFYTNAGADLQERMRIDKLGSVSIGSESGNERLKVAGDVVIGGGTTIGLEDGNSEYLRIRGRVDDWYLGVRDAPTGSEHDFFIGLSDLDFTRFNFDRNGNLGLGTEPVADLHLASTGSQQIWIEADTDNSNEAHQPSLRMTQDNGIIIGELGFFDSLNSLSLRTTDTSGGNTHILLQPQGRVGIGTSSPQTMLDVQGAGTAVGGVSATVVTSRFRNTAAGQQTAISIDSQTDQDSVLFFANNGTAVWDVRTDVIHPDFLFPLLEAQYIGGAGVQNAIRIIPKDNEDGFNIVPGEDNETSLGSPSGFLGAWSAVTTYALFNLSDARLKTDVEDLNYGIEEINRLRPVRFRWSARPEDGERLGVIAQEVTSVIPEVVGLDEDDPDVRMTVDYIQLVPVLIRALQDQQQEIEFLRDRVDYMESNFQALGGVP